eukprot:1175091-Alexandrium_andersonii.AAC.1
MHECTRLVEFVSRLRWGFNAERAVEGGHAMINIRTSAARCRTEAYDSVALRFHDLPSAVDEDAQTFVDCITIGRSPKK